VYAADDGEYRGSLVLLKSGTAYEITLVQEGGTTKSFEAETWCESLPIAETVYVPTDKPQEAPFEIKDVSGSPDGYILYTAHPDESGVLDGANVQHNIVIEDSSYVIIRGLSLQNASRDAIYLKGRGQTHDIVIENNVIENWGRVNESSGFAEADHAIRTDNGKGTNLARLIIQRNVFRNPRGDTNSWSEIREDRKSCIGKTRCHPYGAGAMFLKQTAGNHVIRYNEISSTNGNYFNDAIGGAYNDNVIGAPNKDSDIYGNLITHVWDDAIESEGGNKNVRIWGNFIDRTFVAIGLTPIAKGPVYVFRNIVHRTQRSPDQSTNSGVFIKNKTKPDIGGGKAYVIHNTIYRENGVGGVTMGVSATGTSLVNFTGKNNIIESARRAYASDDPASSPTNDLDYDLYQGTLKNLPDQEAHGIADMPVYDPTHFSGAFAQVTQAEGSPGLDAGIAVANFNDDAVGLPDMGAQERGAPPLEFGVNAYQGSEQDTPPAPSCKP
jgi:hypothetical protein